MLTQLWQLECYDALPSTSDYCINYIRQGGTAELAVLARKQTCGRGSRGRHWVDSGQALALSVVLKTDQHCFLEGWPFVTSLAFYEGLVRVVPQVSSRLLIKWPNDILLDGRKLGGILIEKEASFVVIGLGANLLHAPNEYDIGYKAAYLGMCGEVPDVVDVAKTILDCLAFYRDIWLVKGFEEIRTSWLTRAHPLGTFLVVESENTHEEGYFSGITSQGYLLLDTIMGMKNIVTGSVLLPDRR